MLGDVLALQRSSRYSSSVERDEGDLQKAEQVVEQFPTYGSRCVADRLRREQSELKTTDRHWRRTILMPEFFDLAHQLLRDFIFGFSNRAPDPESRFGVNRRPAQEHAAVVFLRKSFFPPLCPT